MTRIFYQKDTAADDGEVAACSGLTVSELTSNRAVSSTAPVGSGTTNWSTKSGSNERAGHFESAAGQPGETSWPSGTAVVRINITTGNSAVTLQTVHLCRVDSTGSNLGTWGSATPAVAATSGVKTVNVTVSSIGSTNASDQIYCVVGILRNTGHSTETITITNDQQWDTPFAAAGAALVEVVNETEQVVEAAPLRPLKLVRLQNETEALVDGRVSAATYLRIVNETVAIPETNPHLKAMVEVLDEEEQLPETIVNVISTALVEVLDETVAVAETNPHLTALVRVLDEAEEVPETTPTAAVFLRVLDETEEIPETIVDVLTSLGIVKVIDEVEELGETTPTAMALVRIWDEEEQLGETTPTAATLVRLLDEDEEIGEGIVHLLPGAALVAIVDEVEGIVEGLVVARIMVRIVDEDEELVEVAVTSFGPWLLSRGDWSVAVNVLAGDRIRLLLSGAAADTPAASVSLPIRGR